MGRAVFESVESAESPLFEGVIGIYYGSFIPAEAKPREAIIGLLEGGNYFIRAAVISGAVVGIAMTCMLRRLGAGIIDSLAVIEGRRGEGFGKALFADAVGMVKREVPGAACVFLEVQREDLPGLGTEEKAARRRRLRFYSSLGVKRLEGVDYIMPSHIRGAEERMHLLALPLGGLSSLGGDFVRRAIQEVYAEVYPGSSAGVLKRFEASIGSAVKLVDLQKGHRP